MSRTDPTKWSSSAVTVKPLPQIQNQVGPTCGLTALSIVMNFWYTLLLARYRDSPHGAAPSSVALRSGPQGQVEP